MKKPLYPLLFSPILKEKIWGGNRLRELFNKEASGKIGESWELSAVEDNISVISNGVLKGTSLDALINTYTYQILGKKVFNTFGNKFPLLFKFIDATDDLSVQLHPDNALSMERHSSFGKTEMWYIMSAENNARLILGFKEHVTQQDFEKAVATNTIPDIIKEVPVKKGDSYFIAPGTVHAIGAGIVLAEIQQTSDITYRLYDWDRPDLDGKMRTLHIEESKQAINFNLEEPKLATHKEQQGVQLLKSTPYFETNKLVLNGTIKRDLKYLDSFIVYMCVAGSATITSNHTNEVVASGQTILIPHTLANVEIKGNDAILLEVYIP